MYFQNIKVSDQLGQPFGRKNENNSKKALFAIEECAQLKSPEEINMFLRVGHFYEAPIFSDQFPISHW